MKRRQFIGYIGASLFGAALPGQIFASDRTSTWRIPAVPSNTGANGRVIIVGGGMAGATLAKYLRIWGGQGVKVTLVDQNASYISNIMSNLVLNGSTTLTKLTINYSALTANYGINFVQGSVVGLLPPSGSSAGTVTLLDGRVLEADKIVLAPGIEFDAVAGLSADLQERYVPHAWKAGPQTALLAKQLRAMPAGGTFVMSIPAAPYRCPPGPYERACVVADWLKKNKPGSKVIVLDANPYIQAERTGFELAFSQTHAGVIDYRPNHAVDSVAVNTVGGRHTVNTSFGSESADVLNVIPTQRAGRIITDSGLGLANSAGRWAAVDVRSYESTAARNVYVLGDSAASGQPKAGHIANQEAKICADAIVRALRGDTSLNPSPRTNSACYSPITADTASWLTVVYTYDAATGKMIPVPGAGPTEASRHNHENYEQMQSWFLNLMSDSFT